MNCGRCGNVCRADNPFRNPVDCVNGVCEPAWGACFQRSEFNTCDAYCASIGEVCRTCTAGTWLSWGSANESNCGRYVQPSSSSYDPCGQQLPGPGGVNSLFVCCCGK
jgi:hypothetical protein